MEDSAANGYEPEFRAHTWRLLLTPSSCSADHTNALAAIDGQADTFEYRGEATRKTREINARIKQHRWESLLWPIRHNRIRDLDRAACRPAFCRTVRLDLVGRLLRYAAMAIPNDSFCRVEIAL